MAVNEVELESLFVRITTKTTGFFGQMSQVMKAIEQTTEKFKTLTEAVKEMPARMAVSVRVTEQAARANNTLAGSANSAANAIKNLANNYGILQKRIQAGAVGFTGDKVGVSEVFLARVKKMIGRAEAEAEVGATRIEARAAAVFQKAAAKTTVPTVAGGYFKRPATADELDMVRKAIGRSEAAAEIGATKAQARAASILVRGAAPPPTKPPDITAWQRFGASLPPINNNLQIMSQVATALTVTLGMAGLAGALSRSVREFAKFDDEMTKIAIRTRDFNQANRAAMTGGLMEMATRTRTPIMELTKALNVLRSAGFGADAALKALDITNRFAVASGMEAGHATQRLTDILTQLGMISGNTSINYANLVHLSDLLVGIAPLAHASVAEMTDALGGQFLSTLKATGVSLKDAVALTAIYSLEQRRGHDVSVIASRALLEMNDKAVKQAMIWKLMGVSIHDANYKMIDLVDILQALNKEVGQLTAGAKIARLNELFGRQFGQRIANSILPLSEAAGALRTFRNEEEKVAGVTAQAAEAMERNFAGAMGKFRNEMTIIGIQLGSKLAPYIMAVTNLLVGFFHVIRDINAALGGAIGFAIRWGLAFGLVRMFMLPVLGLIFQLTAAWDAYRKAQQLAFGTATVTGFVTNFASKLNLWAVGFTVLAGAIALVAEKFMAAKAEAAGLKSRIDQLLATRTATGYLAGMTEEEFRKEGIRIERPTGRMIDQMIQLQRPGGGSEVVRLKVPEFETVWMSFGQAIDRATKSVEGLKEADNAAAVAIREAENVILLSKRDAELALKKGDVVAQREFLQKITAAERQKELAEALSRIVTGVEPMERIFGPGKKPGEPEGMAPTTGPGFVFKQISLERFMIGGPQRESLEYQQLLTLQMIHGTLTTIANRLPVPSLVGPPAPPSAALGIGFLGIMAP